MKISLLDLGDRMEDPVTGYFPSQSERHRAIVDASAAADEAGFHSVHIGEHHGLEYIYSAPPVILAAIAERTKNLRLSTGVTLAANLDPVRVAEDYATVDVLSGGRCEVVVGRGHFFADTYALFGQSVDDSHELFKEAINGFSLQPQPVAGMPLWIGGGASGTSVELAARLGLDLLLPSVFGDPEKLKPGVEVYREKFASYGHGREPRIGAAWHVNVGKTSQAARERWEPRYRAYFDLMTQRGSRAKPTSTPFYDQPLDFDHVTTHGPAMVGSPAEVADRLSRAAELLTADTHLLSLNMGGCPTEEFIDMVELIGAEMIPQLD
ncbi:LLM class flavin-dependent oxidoreductase [Amycolatopsis sp. NPDC051102]|uniref:LLM class flavin-dependent oxidoreductase n=1 Tax=Amycolatopsis sp. NPDC051102 TaxID=3155163 RepID=UPI00341A60FA